MPYIPYPKGYKPKYDSPKILEWLPPVVIVLGFLIFVILMLINVK